MQVINAISLEMWKLWLWTLFCHLVKIYCFLRFPLSKISSNSILPRIPAPLNWTTDIGKNIFYVVLNTKYIICKHFIY